MGRHGGKLDLTALGSALRDPPPATASVHNGVSFFLQLRCSRVWLEPAPGAGAMSPFSGLCQGVRIPFKAGIACRLTEKYCLGKLSLNRLPWREGKLARVELRDAQPGNSCT